MMHSNNYLDEENKDIKPFLEEITDDVNEHENIENDCVLTKINNSNIKNKKTARKLKFSREEKSNILNNKMLSDESIDLAQQLLKKKFPIFGGLQDITLSEHYGLNVVKKDKPFIQVLYNGSGHWICVFNSDRNRSENNTCHILNSLSRGKITKNVEKKICALLLCKEIVIKVAINSVHQQANGVDCTVFETAYATSLAFGENPTLCSYNVPLMRQHLVNCLEKEMMYPFPKQDSTKRVLKCKKSQLLLSIYCSCRSVCQYERENPMVECKKCYEWFQSVYEQSSQFLL